MPLILTPETIRAKIAEAKAAVDSLASDVSTSDVSWADSLAFESFLSEFDVWHKDVTNDFLEGWWASDAAVADDWIRRVAEWRERFTAAGGRVSGPTPRQEKDKDPYWWAPYAILGVIVVVGLFAARGTVRAAVPVA